MRTGLVGGEVEEPLNATLAFMRLLWALDHALQKRSKRMVATLGVTGPQRLALLIIGRGRHMSAGRVAETLKIHPSTLTGILQRLHRRGLITRRRVVGDERRLSLGLTRRGRILAQGVEGTVEWAVGRVLRQTARPRVVAAETLLKQFVLELERDE